MVKLVLASAFTLFALFAFLFVIMIFVSFLPDFFGFYGIQIGTTSGLIFLIAVTLVISLIIWLVSPKISDWIYRFLYKLEWIGIDGLRARDETAAEFLTETCKKYKIKVPKIGIIPDDNPQAFSYGSGAWNSRIVFTEGLFTYLKSDERTAVFAHELGHVVHRDFIVMTVASVLIQIFYEIYAVGIRMRGRKNNPGPLIAAVSYVFYIISIYIVLFLSRVREYYADEFAAEETRDPNSLSSALLKVAYGIIARPDNDKQTRLLKSTRHLGIMDFKAAKGTGLIYLHALKLKNWEPINKAFLYDLKNPWAFINELSSTHPLTGKRIKRLSDMAQSFKLKSLFDFDKIESYPIDRSKLYEGFFSDILMICLPILFTALGIGILLLDVFRLLPIQFSIFQIIGGFIILLGLSFMAQTFYRYRSAQPEKTTTLDMLGDVYASPIRGKPVMLQGTVVGRGIPGYIFSEDMLFQDKTGLIYLNYESLIPFFGNLYFAWKKLETLLNKPSTATGWFIRRLSPSLELKELDVENNLIKGRIKTINLIVSSIFLFIGAFFLLL